MGARLCRASSEYSLLLALPWGLPRVMLNFCRGIEMIRGTKARMIHVAALSITIVAHRSAYCCNDVTRACSRKPEVHSACESAEAMRFRRGALHGRPLRAAPRILGGFDGGALARDGEEMVVTAPRPR